MPSSQSKPSEQTPSTPHLALAEILSDLTSLRVCDPTAAIALVSARLATTTTITSKPPPPLQETNKNNQNQEQEQEEAQDEDLKRAKDLVELHYKVKVAQTEGRLEEGLAEARRAVERVV